MRTLDRYIARHVVGAALLTLLALLAVFSIVDFVDDLSDIGKGNYTLGRAVEYMALTMPRRAFALFPLAAVIGSLIGLGTLATNRELVVMRASGVSTAHLAVAALKAALVLAAAALVVGEVLAPRAERLAEQRRAVALAGRMALETRSGFWIRDANTFINVRDVLPDRRMKNLFIYEFDDRHRLRVVTHAEHAAYRDGQWLLESVVQSVIDRAGVERRELETAAWSSAFEPELADLVTVHPEGLSLVGLYRYIDYLRSNDLRTARFELAFWSKLAYPAATAVMIFLALPLVLGRLGTGGVGPRIVVGTLIAVGFHVVQQASGHVGLVYGLDPAFCALAPTLAFFGVGVWLVRRSAM